MTTDRHCLDAETVAAWMDGGLDAASVAAAEAHASNCERCQALLATIVKTIPAESVVSGFSRIDEQRARLWKWWLAPLAATAAAVTIWMVVPQTPLQSPPVAPVAREDMQEKARSAEPVAAEPPPAAPSAAVGQAGADAKRKESAQQSNQLADADTQARDTLARNRADRSPKREQTEGFAETKPTAPAAAADAALAERVRETPAATPAPSAPAAPALSAPRAPSAPSAPAELRLSKQVAAPVIVSPDPNSRWRATAPGTVERSEDGGRVWLPVRINAGEEVLAGASPSRLACWLVGRNGLVLLATDGTNFTRLPFPASIDLVAVTSPEPRIAIVSAADGRMFRTADGGRTWLLQ